MIEERLNMLLRNKKTGEIVECLAKISFVEKSYNGLSTGKCRCFDSIDLLNEEWEDYEDLKEYWFIDEFGLVQKEVEYYYEENKEAVHNKRISIGNYFETKEEAEQTVEKLKAWKRLKDKGVHFEIKVIDRKWYLEPKSNPKQRTFTEAYDLMEDVNLLFEVDNEQF